MVSFSHLYSELFWSLLLLNQPPHFFHYKLESNSNSASYPKRLCLICLWLPRGPLSSLLPHFSLTDLLSFSSNILILVSGSLLCLQPGRFFSELYSIESCSSFKLQLKCRSAKMPSLALFSKALLRSRHFLCSWKCYISFAALFHFLKMIRPIDSLVSWLVYLLSFPSGSKLSEDKGFVYFVHCYIGGVWDVLGTGMYSINIYQINTWMDVHVNIVLSYLRGE